MQVLSSVTVIGAFIFCAAYVVPACLGVSEAILDKLYRGLPIVITAFFTYRGSKMGVVNGNGK